MNYLKTGEKSHCIFLGVRKQSKLTKNCFAKLTTFGL